MDPPSPILFPNGSNTTSQYSSHLERVDTYDSLEEFVTQTPGARNLIESHEQSNNGSSEVLKLLPSLRISTRTLLNIERRNDRLDRTLRVIQKELKVVGGNKIQTRIEVIDNYLPNSPVIFSVKHTHGNPWGRQMIVHKNLLLACILTGVNNPPLDIPQDSHKMFENTDNIPHMHSYMERVLPHIRYPNGAPQGVRLYWWRAVENGATVLQNESTGRLIVIPNRDKRLTGAADTILRCLTLIRHLVSLGTKDLQKLKQISGGSFLIADPLYPTNVPHSRLTELSDPNRELSPDELKEAVQRWAVEQQVSPWMTQMVVRTRGLRKSQVTNIRYSVDVDPGDTKALSMQIHSNEPLSRELQAFPVCMVPMPLLDTSCKEVYLRFLQALWFLKKLFDFHQEVESGDQKRLPTDTQFTTRSQSALRRRGLSSVISRAPQTQKNHSPGQNPLYPSPSRKVWVSSPGSSAESSRSCSGYRSPSTPRTQTILGNRQSVSPLPTSTHLITPTRRSVPRHTSIPSATAGRNDNGLSFTRGLRHTTPSKNPRFASPLVSRIVCRNVNVNALAEVQNEVGQNVSTGGIAPSDRPHAPLRPDRQQRILSEIYRK